VEKKTKDDMEAALDHFRQELRNLRSGRANPGLLDSVKVEAYGSEMRIKELGNVTVSEARQLLVTPFDPQMAGPIGKGIEKANLGVQPNVDGAVVRVPIPPLTEELRKDIVKQAKNKAEDAKIAVRDVRKKGNDAIKKLKSSGDIAEDEQKKMEKSIQEITDKYCKVVDELFKEKEKDILVV
jgi:ribosome recycling factor